MVAEAQRLRLDRSRNFATVHGERRPGDKHQMVHFIQDGIHFDAGGLHLDDLVEDEQVRSLVDRRLKKQGKTAPKGADKDDLPPDNGGGPSEVNLEAWLRGEARYQWFSITKIVRERFSINITNQADMVEFLVNEKKLVPVDQVDPDLAALLKSTD